MQPPWPQTAVIEQLGVSTPCLAIRSGVFDALVRTEAERHRTAGLKWRPPPSWSGLHAAAGQWAACGAAGVSVGHADEAARAVSVGVPSVLILVPPGLKSQQRQVASLCRSAKVTVACDHFAQAEPIAAACQSEGVEAGVLLRVDVGPRRLGVRPGPDLADLACGVSRLAGVRLAGLLVGEPSVPIGSVGRLVADRAVPRFLNRCLSSLRRAGCESETVSVSDLDDLAGLSSVATEARTPLPLFRSGSAAVLTAIIGRPTRDIAVVDAGCDFLGSSAKAAGVPRDEAEVAFIGRDYAVLELHQPDHAWAIGDVIVLSPGAEFRPRAGHSVLIGEGDRWRVEATR